MQSNDNKRNAVASNRGEFLRKFHILGHTPGAQGSHPSRPLPLILWKNTFLRFLKLLIFFEIHALVLKLAALCPLLTLSRLHHKGVLQRDFEADLQDSGNRGVPRTMTICVFGG